MIDRLSLARSHPEHRAELIYQEARADLSSRLWRAALGDGATERTSPFEKAELHGGSISSLLSLLEARSAPEATARFAPSEPALNPQPLVQQAIVREEHQAEPQLQLPTEGVRTDGLGVNARYQPILEGAARRTGIPSPALAAIVHAEAAKGRDGAWNLYSRNPRSSAAGLGQFLSGTWIGEAQRPGTWLNETARARGWLSEGGKVLPTARSELLSLRYDAEASINATADYARGNLDRMKRAGVQIGSSIEETARAAYLGHHLGLGDASKFLKGGLNSSRARMLLAAQIGSANAGERIARAGDATAAHRTWLMDFVGRHVRPGRFQA